MITTGCQFAPVTLGCDSQFASNQAGDVVVARRHLDEVVQYTRDPRDQLCRAELPIGENICEQPAFSEFFAGRIQRLDQSIGKDHEHVAGG